MTEDIKNKIITRAIHFIATNTNADSQRIGAAIIEELKQVKLFAIPVVIKAEGGAVCFSCDKYETCKDCIEPNAPTCKIYRKKQTDL